MPRRLALLLGICCLALPRLARADGEDEAKRAEAKRLTTEGSALYTKGDFANALKDFQAAYAALPTNKLLFNIGEAQLHLGHKAEAATAFNQFLDGTLEAADIAPQRKLAKEKMAELVQGLARVRVDAVPNDALVNLDGQLLPEGGAFVAPGKHQLEANKPGFKSVAMEISVHGAEDRKVSMRLEADVPAATATLTPPVESAPAPAAAPVVLVAPAPPPDHTASWVLIGLGAASLATSAVTGVLAANDNGKLANAVNGSTPLTNAQVASLRTSVRTEAWISTATLGAGAVAAGVGAFLLMRGDKSAVATTAVDGQPALALRF